MAGAMLENLDQHMDKVNDGFKCLICEKFFKRKASAKRHVRDVHVAVKYLKCPVADCTQAFKYHNVRRRHIIKDHAENNMMCPIVDCIYKSTDIAL